jgi:spore cortex formation protein SpoVR/YcgB (stage V sporulation)
MNKKEEKMLDKIFNLDCYDQELWVIDNENFIKNASDEFKITHKRFKF